MPASPPSAPSKLGPPVPSLVPSGFAFEALSTARVAWFALGVVAVTYFAFQKHLLPDPVARIVSKLFFFPTFPITGLLRLGNYWTKVDDTLLVGCAPLEILNHPSLLKKMGVSTVINMCYEYSGPLSGYSKNGIRQLHLPTLDHTEVPLEFITEAIDCIEECRKRGEKVLVHCKAGNGRAASIALCWMMHQNKDKSVKELNDLLLKKRKVRAKMFKQSNILAYDDFLRRSRK